MSINDSAPMARLPILIVPDPVLRKISRPVERVDEAVRRLLDDMVQSMIEGKGIGLAAIQVARPLRLIVTHLEEDEAPAQTLKLVNPEILWRSNEERVYEEGCLSLPDQTAEVARPARVRVRYVDEHGELREREAEGLLATCLQHEIDHLDGVLFIDYLSAVKRNIIVRKLKKAQRTAAVRA